jgi:quinol monooxygenase YgiN
VAGREDLVTLTVTYTVKAGHEDDAKAVIAQIRELASAEDGVVFFAAQQSQADPRRILLYEQWRDAAAIEAHQQQPYYRELIQGRLYPLAEGRPLVEAYIPF